MFCRGDEVKRGGERRNNRAGDWRSRAEKKRARLLSGYEEEAGEEKRAA